MDYNLIKSELIVDEDKRNFLYPDTVGKWTIGIGRNIEDNGLSDGEVDYLFRNDVLRVTKELDDNLPWWRNLSEVRQRVVFNMCFNMGITKYLKFKNTLKAIQEARWGDAKIGMIKSKWHKDVGQRAIRLEYMMLNDKVMGNEV